MLPLWRSIFREMKRWVIIIFLVNKNNFKFLLFLASMICNLHESLLPLDKRQRSQNIVRVCFAFKV